MNKLWKYSSFCMVMITIFISCKGDSKETEEYLVEGRWQIFEAFRNNELTTTLDDGYFSFKDSTMETNILGSPISGKFSLVGRTISHDSDLPLQYEIDYYSQDTLVLETSIRDFDFIFKVAKADTADIN